MRCRVKGLLEFTDATGTLLVGPRHAGAAFQPGKQLISIQRFQHKVVHTRCERSEHIRWILPPGHHDDIAGLSGRKGAHRLADMESVQPGHFPIQKSNLGGVRSEQNLEGLLSILRENPRKSVPFQQPQQAVPGAGVVLRDEDTEGCGVSALAGVHWRSNRRCIHILTSHETLGRVPERGIGESIASVQCSAARRITPRNQPKTTMKLETLKDLFIHELKDLYSAETQLLKALPKMAKAATNADLKAGFEEHLEQTKTHVERLKKIATDYDCKLSGHQCKAMAGLIEEGGDLISQDADDAVRDAGLIGAAQRVEHYEIAAYGTACALANCLGYEESAELLGATLEEEKETDEKLTELAESVINAEAAAVDASE